MKIVGVEKYNDDSQSKPKIVGVEKYNTGNPAYKASGNIQLNNESNLNPERQRLMDIYNAAKPYAQTAGRFAAGAAAGGIQGAANSLASTANLVPETINLIAGTRLPTFQKTDVMRQFLPKDSQAANYGFTAGNIGGELAGYGGAYKAADAIPKLNDASSIIQNILKGSLAGLSAGEFEPGGRVPSATLGAITGPAHQLSDKNLVKNFFKNMNKEESTSKKMYRNVFDKFSGKDIARPSEGNFDAKKLLKSIPGNKKAEVQKYIENPTVENAHWAQSDLGKLKNKLDMKQAGNVDLYNRYNNAQKAIKDAMFKAMENKGPEFNKAYSDASDFYKKRVVPYQRKDVDLYEMKKLNDSQFIKSLTKNPEFLSSAPGKENKLLRGKDLINSILNKKNTSIGLSSAALAMLGMDKYKDRERIYGDTQQ